MYKVLLLSYTPRVGSRTACLVETAIEHLPQGAQVTYVDLAANPPPLLEGELLNALIKANFTDEVLTAKELAKTKAADTYVTQLLNADRIIVAFPMYNFSLPAPVKAWVDVVVQKDKTFSIDSNGQYKGLCKGKSVLIIMTAGSDFNDAHLGTRNYALPLLMANFEFMGISSASVCAYGLDQYPEKCSTLIERAQSEVVGFLSAGSQWSKAETVTA